MILISFTNTYLPCTCHQEHFTGDKKNDPSLQDDYVTAKAKHEELDEPEVMFRPADEVSAQQRYGYSISQEFACLNGGEFHDMFGEKPNHSALNVKPTMLPWNGPGQKEVEFYLVALEGLTLEQIMTCRKIRLEFSSGVLWGEFYLQPSDQLTDDQGNRMFSHLSALHSDRRPQGLKVPPTKDPPKSAKTIFKLLEKFTTTQSLRDEKIQREAARASVGDGDEFDDMLLDSEDEPEGAPQKKRRAGFSGSLASAPAAKAPKKTAKPGKESKARKGDGTPTESTAVPASLQTEDGLSVRSGNAGGQKAKLDPEMQIVAGKHVGSSTKCLEGLEPRAFLLEVSSRVSLSAKLRGVWFPVVLSCRNQTHCH